MFFPKKSRQNKACITKKGGIPTFYRPQDHQFSLEDAPGNWRMERRLGGVKTTILYSRRSLLCEF